MNGRRVSCGKKSKPLKFGISRMVTSFLDRHLGTAADSPVGSQPVVDEKPDDGDGGKDGGENADGERDGKAADRSGAKPEHDEGAGQRGELRVGNRHEGACEAGVDAGDG